MLTQREISGRSRLLIADLDTPRIQELPVPEGTIHDVSFAPDGTVHYLWSRGGAPAAQLTAHPQGGAARSPGHRTEPSSATTDLWTPAGYGDIHSFVTTPGGDPLWPMVFLVHGGPATHDRDCADPRVDALSQAGYAVVRTNYRGSTGYGPAWQHNFGGRVGLAQAEDLAAVRARLLDLGLATGDRIALFGYSWGGYLALLVVVFANPATALGVDAATFAVSAASLLAIGRTRPTASVTAKDAPGGAERTSFFALLRTSPLLRNHP